MHVKKGHTVLILAATVILLLSSTGHDPAGGATIIEPLVTARGGVTVENAAIEDGYLVAELALGECPTTYQVIVNGYSLDPPPPIAFEESMNCRVLLDFRGISMTRIGEGGNITIVFRFEGSDQAAVSFIYPVSGEAETPSAESTTSGVPETPGGGELYLPREGAGDSTGLGAVDNSGGGGPTLREIAILAGLTAATIVAAVKEYGPGGGGR